MNRTIVVAAALGVATLCSGLGRAQSADPSLFDLTVQLNLTHEVTALLKPGDRLQVILRPEVQYGLRTVAGAPVEVERIWQPGNVLLPIVFKEAVAPDQIYRLELQIERHDARGRVTETRYLSALDKSPRKPVTQPIALRLQRADRADRRDNHVMLVRDSDGVYRMMLFFA